MVTGSFSYDSEVTDEMPSNPFSGLYSADALDLEINGYRYTSTDNNIAIVNDAVVFPGSPIVDVFEFVSPLRDVSGPDLSGLPIAQIDITLVDTSARTFQDDSLPVELDVGKFDITSEEPFGTTGGRLIFQSLSTGGIGEIRFEIDAIELATDSHGDKPSKNGWKQISGSVLSNGNPVCAMVLANGQYMFTCKAGDDFGKYELDVPLDSQDQITIQAFVSGLAPFRQTTDESDLTIDIDMQAADPESQSPDVTRENQSDASTPTNWARINGTVSFNGTPLCAMVLANGQYIFSCGENEGVYDLTVPLDGNGQITLYVFVSGKRPYKQTFTP